jgi:hypothetical protein
MNRTKVSNEAPDWFKVVTEEKIKKYDEHVIKNEETLSVFSRYQKWITVTPRTKNRRKSLERQKITKMEETSKIMPSWMQIKKQEVKVPDQLQTTEYNSMRNV